MRLQELVQIVYLNSTGISVNRKTNNFNMMIEIIKNKINI